MERVGLLAGMTIPRFLDWRMTTPCSLKHCGAIWKRLLGLSEWYRTGRALVAEALRLRPDVIVTDVTMPSPWNGLDAARRIKEQAPKIGFVFLTMRRDPNLAAAALELGPIGFVLKQSTGQELLKAVDHVLHLKSYVTP